MKEIPAIASALVGLLVFWVAKSYVSWTVAAILGFVALTLINLGWFFCRKKLRQ